MEKARLPEEETTDVTTAASNNKSIRISRGDMFRKKCYLGRGRLSAQTEKNGVLPFLFIYRPGL